MEQFGETQDYYLYHVAMMNLCLEWTTKLTMAINSGILGDSPVKEQLAQVNRREYEQFLVLICNNIKKFNEKLGENIIIQVNAELTNIWLLENLQDDMLR